jgi:hypothetical protein
MIFFIPQLTGHKFASFQLGMRHLPENSNRQEAVFAT